MMMRLILLVVLVLNTEVSSLSPAAIARQQEAACATHNRKWMERFDELCDFMNENGHSSPSVTDSEASTRRLARWVRNQRLFYTYLRSEEKREQAFITPERIEMLNSVGFVWSVQNAKWNSRFQELAEFQQTHGHCVVPRNKGYDGLANWISQQRNRFKGKWGRPLTENERSRLESLGFQWDPYHDRWWRRYDELVQYKKAHGHCRVPQNWETSPALGKWARNQRRICQEYLVAVFVEGRVKGVTVSGLDERRLSALRRIDFYDLPDPSQPVDKDRLLPPSLLLRRQTLCYRKVTDTPS